MKPLHKLDKDEYIKHLEEYLLNHMFYERCQQCKRVEHQDHMTALDVGPDLIYVCDTCLLAWERAENRAQEIAASDEKDYRAAKGNR
jgi:hypothetical protein